MKFLWQYFISQYEDLRNLAKGSNQANLNAGMIKDYLVPLPNLEEQKQFEQLVEQSDKSKHVALKTTHSGLVSGIMKLLQDNGGHCNGKYNHGTAG